jgi:hypothetical protein
MGAVFCWDALRELMDEGLSREEVTAIGDLVRDTPGVVGLHELRTRRMAHKVLIDAHIQVDGHISVSEGHRIGEEVRNRVLRGHPDVLDMLVHVDPENDLDGPRGAPMPGRHMLEAHLRQLLGDQLPTPVRIQLHYLGNRVEAEVLLPGDMAQHPGEGEWLDQRLREALVDDPYFRSVTVNRRIAPK